MHCRIIWGHTHAKAMRSAWGIGLNCSSHQESLIELLFFALQWVEKKLGEGKWPVQELCVHYHIGCVGRWQGKRDLGFERGSRPGHKLQSGGEELPGVHRIRWSESLREPGLILVF